MNLEPVIGFIGLGRMGGPMVKNLLQAGHSVVGYDIDSAKMEELVKAGGSPGASPADVAKRSRQTFSIIMNDDVFLDVALGPNGILSGAAPGHLYCDLSTVSPAASAKVALAMEAAGLGYLRGKVAGSIALAEAAKLTIFVSGSEAHIREAEPVLGLLGERVLNVGNGEMAHYLKLVHSTIVGVYAALIGEALAFGEKGGLDFNQMVDVLESGPLGSVQLSLKAQMLKGRTFENPPSDVNTAAKDLDLVLAAAKDCAVSMPLTSAVRQIMSQQQAVGGGKRDIWSLVETFESMSGVYPSREAMP
jgi:3-hydroxyisobutyrate dehydrogenase-like beta-hydroxyacid dehydrogenase